MKAMNVDSQELPVELYNIQTGFYRSEDHDGRLNAQAWPINSKEAIADEDELPAAVSLRN